LKSHAGARVQKIVATSSSTPTLATAFEPNNNSLNAQRLIFSALVIFAHTWPAGGFGRIDVGYSDPGAFGVDGFFVISGFLVTGSCLRASSVRRFLWFRFLRIYPGLLTALLLVALVTAPLAWLHDRGTLAGYFSATPHGPATYVVSNLELRGVNTDIAGTPDGVPWPAPPVAPSWNVPLWTLHWEVLCYLGVAVLGVTAVLRRRPVVVLSIFIAVWIVLVVRTVGPEAGPVAHGGAQASVGLRFAPLFLSGMLLSLYADRIKLSGKLAAVAALGVAGSFAVPEPRIFLALTLGYLCLWLAVRVPTRRFGYRRDLSYGLYVYSSPILQLATIYHLQRLGPALYSAVTGLVTVLLAWISWTLVERRALELKQWTPRLPARWRPATTDHRGGNEPGMAPVQIALQRTADEVTDLDSPTAGDAGRV